MANKEVSISHPLAIFYGCGTAAVILGSYRFYRVHLRRLPTAGDIPKQFFGRKFLRGKVTSVGDGDNFHLYHTPGGIFTGWGWIRPLPEVNQFRKLKNKTIHVRLCGVDAPECSHFGKPAQPFSTEALQWLRNFLLSKKVYVKPLHLDQYNRIVSKVMVLKWNGFKDVSQEMIKLGIGTVYEAKQGAEFDGKETQYRHLEHRARVRKLGLWGVKTPKGGFVSPRDYKNMYK
ncbi:hypothetical protein CANARDRAFT_200075 [[Candida] arabinofermentans NRRL YB-2248]|uniref:Probable endonuclease LCL3 n=1 Tax=[Candida] arabinofermentans NRRL YB-2248 TaxID=983967 RepID=A0A1E4SYX6_9ASCO|nr:hypothetical protein CANARDRAFT_200075 [[Candida] arabinofermentans NRRL YB-2248]